jgi:pimeloyl-ACP methyl ester carboxylesterase
MLKVFGPSPVPKKFKGFPEEMAVRPSQIRAGAAESALMIRLRTLSKNSTGCCRCRSLFVAGAADRLIESEQSAHLHGDIPHSTLRYIPGTGHMVHQTATENVMSVIDTAAAQTRTPVAVKPVAGASCDKSTSELGE